MNNKDKNKNKKMNEKTNELQASMTRSLWGDLPPSAWTELKLEDFATPAASLPVLAVLGEALARRVTDDASAGEKRTGKALRSASQLGARAVEYNRLFEVRTMDTKPLRLMVVRLSSGIIDTLTLQTGSPVVEIAEAGKKLKTEVFGDDFRPGVLKATSLYQRMCQVEGALTRNPALRKALESAVPPAQVAAMLVAHQRLGERVMGVDEDAELDDGVDLRSITVGVRQRIGEYVVSVLGTVSVEQQETVARAKRLLRPLTRLRKELTKERTRRARIAAGLAVEEEAEELEDADELEAGEEDVADAPADPTTE